MPVRMSEDADTFIQHADAVLGMARRVSALGVAIYKHEYLTLAFGSWVLVAGTRHHRLQFTWDGRDFAFTISRASAGDSRQPLAWQHVRTVSLQKSEAIAEMERVLHESFATGRA
jgi:hypothetical protein